MSVSGCETSIVRVHTIWLGQRRGVVLIRQMVEETQKANKGESRGELTIVTRTRSSPALTCPTSNSTSPHCSPDLTIHHPRARASSDLRISLSVGTSSL
jgi:hypothetical protein